MPSGKESTSSLLTPKKRRGTKHKIPPNTKPQSKDATEESESTTEDTTNEGDNATKGTKDTSEVTRQDSNVEAPNLEASITGLVKEAGEEPDEDSQPTPKVVESESCDESSAGEKQTLLKSSEPIESAPDGLEREGTENVELQQDRQSDYRRMFFMGHFHSSDIILQMDGRTVLIAGSHDRHADEHGFVTRTFVRMHTLPDKVIAEKLTSFLTGDGVLVIQAPYMENPEDPVVENGSIQPEV